MSRVLGIVLLVAFLLKGADAYCEFEKVLPGREFTFPRDHGSHDEFGTEWWYFTGHLKANDESMFGFELVFFRVGVEGRGESAWAFRNIYLAHFAVTDERNNRFLFSERKSRGSFDEAGSSEETLKAWIGDWSAQLLDNKFQLSARDSDKSISLELRSMKKPTLQGEGGFSQKSEVSSSYYISLSRMSGFGRLTIGGESYEIPDASVWMDHEFFSTSEEATKLGWDWFAVQLDSGDELMLYQLRDESGEKTKFSSGTIIDRNGETSRLMSDEFSIEVKSRWKSRVTNIVYPSGWTIKVPKLGREFDVIPAILDQELRTKSTTGVAYWEGRARVEEVSGGQGQAYVELVGH